MVKKIHATLLQVIFLLPYVKRTFIHSLMMNLLTEEICCLQTLLAAIERPKISVVIFLENYASSTWCLDELNKIIECKNIKGHILIPVFYHIDPSHICKQSGLYKDAFIKHEKYNQSKVKKWRMALHEASNIAGWDLTNTR